MRPQFQHDGSRQMKSPSPDANTRRMPLRLRRILIILSAPFILLFLGCLMLQLSIDGGARRLIALEKQGHLSRTYGYVWQQIQAGRALRRQMKQINQTDGHITDRPSDNQKSGIDFPSPAAISELNTLPEIDRTVRINDRHGIPLAVLKTVQTSIGLSDINNILLGSLLTAEDKHFRTRKKAYEVSALVRSILHAAWISVRTFRLHTPRGSSTIHMQVARFLLLKYDSRGFAYTEQSLSRKLNELKLAQALSRLYSKDEILTFYINHCVSAGHGMIGYNDISTGLFGVPPRELSIPQSLYLARLVKWNRQVPEKIIGQIKVTLPELAKHFGWNPRQQADIAAQLDTLTFRIPSPVLPSNSYLIDCANEFLHKIGESKGMTQVQLGELDLSDPQSMIRRFGNVTMNLTLDYRLQKRLEKLVGSRGFAPDTIIETDSLIGIQTDTITGTAVTENPGPSVIVLSKDTTTVFKPNPAGVNIRKGSSLVTTVRHSRYGSTGYVRTVMVYKRISRHVTGQYYAYALMDSRTHKLLAWCSTDRLGSRLRSLLVNKNPNGSSVAKPLIYGLAYDLGIYTPESMASDDTEIPDTCIWARSYLSVNGRPTGMIYHHVPEKEGYAVRNHDRRFEGQDFVFNHLATSNNIVAVETMYRVTDCCRSDSSCIAGKRVIAARLGMKRITNPAAVTGPQLYAAIVSELRDTAVNGAAMARNYSVTLGTLELTLYEQLHLFNALYDNSLIKTPRNHPSLFVESAELSGVKIPFSDSVETISLYNDFSRLSPVHLALHKRLISNPADKLDVYDLCDTTEGASNFAKSGTTDDVIRPFDAPHDDTARTNYGLWNAVLRLRLTKNDLKKMTSQDTLVTTDNTPASVYEGIPSEENLDVTLACIGECNVRRTGARDGKTLHGYVSRELLHEFGVPCTTGFYHTYEADLVSDIPDKIKYAGAESSNLSFFSRTLIRLRSGIGSKAEIDEVHFEKTRFGKGFGLRGKSLKKMLGFALYMGDNSRRYCSFIDILKKPSDVNNAAAAIDSVTSLSVSNQIVKRDIEHACTSLRKSLDKFR